MDRNFNGNDLSPRGKKRKRSATQTDSSSPHSRKTFAKCSFGRAPKKKRYGDSYPDKVKSTTSGYSDCSFKKRSWHKLNRGYSHTSSRRKKKTTSNGTCAQEHKRSNVGSDSEHLHRPSQQKEDEYSKSGYHYRRRSSRRRFQIDCIPEFNKSTTVEDTLTSLEEKEPSEIIQELLGEGSTLKEWLSDILPRLVSILRKAFSCKFLPYKTADLFKLTLETDFFNTLALYLVDLQSKEGFENYKTNGLNEFIENILAVLLEITTRSPSSLKSIARLQFVIGHLIEEVTKVDGFKDQTVEQKYKNLKERTKRDVKVKPLQPRHDIYCPLDDFREIDIFPVKSDFQSTLGPLIRENKTKGCYDDLDHYLDVHFRLLREDFIGPLRDGINEYIRATNHGGRKGKRFNDVKIYEHVRVVSPVCLDEGLCYKIQLDTSRLKRIFWTKSKRLIFGSLLCLSSDNFDTFLIATVANRDIEEITSGQLVIRFEGTDMPMSTKDLFSNTFTVVETTAYFESYRHVLSGLQTFGNGDLPFERYLVKCQTDIRPPSYLTEATVFNFKPLLEDLDVTGTLSLHNYESSFSNSTYWEQSVFNVLDTKNWPGPERLGLDESQYNALKSALTREFSLIQGPPGTGKTYIGWKIANILLHNRFKLTTEWHFGKPKPMLIVCYTNHALDQFLEGIVKFYGGNILRVGGQSKSHLLQEFTLKRQKKKVLQYKTHP